MKSRFSALSDAAADALRHAGLDAERGLIWLQGDGRRGDLSASHALVQGGGSAPALAQRTVAAMELEGTPFCRAEAERGFINFFLRRECYAQTLREALGMDATEPCELERRIARLYAECGAEAKLLSRHDAENPAYMAFWCIKRALTLSEGLRVWEPGDVDEDERALIKALCMFGEAESAQKKCIFLSRVSELFYRFYSASEIRADSLRKAICAAVARVMIKTVVQ